MHLRKYFSILTEELEHGNYVSRGNRKRVKQTKRELYQIQDLPAISSMKLKDKGKHTGFN